MVPTEERARPLLPITVGLTLLATGYAGAYYLLVDPNDKVTRGKVHAMYPAGLVDGHQSNYGFLPNFFKPMHSLDRRIRPHVWTAPESELSE